MTISLKGNLRKKSLSLHVTLTSFSHEFYQIELQFKLRGCDSDVPTDLRYDRETGVRGREKRVIGKEWEWTSFGK